MPISPDALTTSGSITPGPVATIRRYHEQTAQVVGRDWAGSRELPDFVPMDPANRPEQFTQFVGLEPQPLPLDLGLGSASAIDVLSGVAYDGPPAVVDTQLLARLLFHTAGVTRVGEKSERRTYFRAAPAAGNLHPVEVYVVCGDLDGLAAGVYHFAPQRFGLHRLRDEDCRPHLAAALADGSVAAAAVTLVLTGVPWRTGWKYSERGLRHIYWDAGTMLANLGIVGAAAGVSHRIAVGFVDAAVSDLVGVDGAHEFPVAAVILGGDRATLTTSTPSPSSPAERPSLRTAPLSPAPVQFPLVVEAQHAGDLHTPDDVLAWRRAAQDAGADAPSDPARWPDQRSADGCSEEGTEALILRRGSTRLMRHEPVPADALRWPMLAATRPIDADWLAPGGSLLSHELSIHQVDGMGSGRYHWGGGAMDPVTLGSLPDVRAEAQHLCLAQPLGGDSAYTAFEMADLNRLFDTLGARGYRAAQLEAGLVAGRLQLAAFALGYGGTGLTFYDDAVPVAFGVSTQCMIAVSIGVPDYRSTPGGGPGRPAKLVHQRQLMDRLMAQLAATR